MKILWTQPSPPWALAIVTGNAVVVGAAGLSIPIAWLLVPGVVSINVRPLLAVAVAAWAAALILISVWIPGTSGHPGDRLSLMTSGLCLGIAPLLSWTRHLLAVPHREPKAPRRQPAAAPAEVLSLQAAHGHRSVALGTSGACGELAAVTELTDGTLRVVLGATAGEVPRPRLLTQRLRALSGGLAADPNLGLPEMARMLDAVVRRTSPDGHVPAILVEVQPNGQVSALRCGGPEIVAAPSPPLPNHGSLVVVDAGPGHPPLGLLEGGAEMTVHRLPNRARLVFTSHSYEMARYADRLPSLQHALSAPTIERAVTQLLDGAHGTDAGLGRGPGPALVVSSCHRQDGSEPVSEPPMAGSGS